MAISTSSSIVFPFSTKPQLPLNQTLFSISPSSSDSHCSWKWRTQLLLHQPSLPMSKRTRKTVLSAISTDSGVWTGSGERENETELARKWREIHGSGDWANLLDPMNPILRSELIRYNIVYNDILESLWVIEFVFISVFEICIWGFLRFSYFTKQILRL